MPGQLIRSAALGSIFTAVLLTVAVPSSPILGSGAAHAQQLVPSSARAGVRSCSEMKNLRSQHSREPTKITFVNKTSTYRALNWIDFKGAQKSYGGLNPGERKTINTFRTHPWVSATGPGDCIQIILPAAEPATVLLK